VEPRIAATDDNRFVMAWEQEVYTNDGWLEDIYYTIRDTNGGTVKGVTKFTNGVADEDYYEVPALAALGGNRALLAYDSPNGISYAVIDSAGNTVKTETAMGGWGTRPDAVQLSDGRIVVAWDDWGWDIEFAVLDGTTYDKTYGPDWLYNPATFTGDGYVSVTADGDGHAILTWMDYDSSYRHNLYYALVDGNGNTLTEPMIFHTSQATSPYIESSYTGCGNTSYSTVSPTTGDVDVWVTSSLVGAAPEGRAAVPASVGNHGSTQATSVVLTATLDSNLSYAGASPSPALVNGDIVTWNLADLDFLGRGRVVLYTDVPSATIGTRYPVTWTIASSGLEADASNNTVTAEVMVAQQVFMPLVMRDD
jgi:hypothetical protein